MPELPEVHTTVTGIQKHVIGHIINDVWSDYDSSYFRGKDDIRNRQYFTKFKKLITGRKIIGAERRAKNVLIHLSGDKSGTAGDKTILIHMKMTGHILYGKYSFSKKKAVGNARSSVRSSVGPLWKSPWKPISPASLMDPFNRHIHFVMILDNGMHLALSDSRKFAKVTLIDTENMHSSIHLSGVGPEPLEDNFTYDVFMSRLEKSSRKPIKITLMDQRIVAGIGNIYADESLWRTGIHPSSVTISIPDKVLRKLYTDIRSTLSKGIDFGGDSMSDYRNIHGERGKFQEEHMVYQRKGEPCKKAHCSGKIERIVVGGRGTHYCPKHQRLYR